MSDQARRTVYDASGPGVALPLALRRASGAGAPEPSLEIATCQTCGVRYFARPQGSPLAEDGHCRTCAQQAAAPSVVVELRRRRRRS